jgi:hypothetical protein
MTLTMEYTTCHAISLLEGEIIEESHLGAIRRVTTDNFPILRGMSIKRVVINLGPMRCTTLRTSAKTPRSSSSRFGTNAPRTSGWVPPSAP